MRKMEILLLVVCMMFGSIGFADDGGGEEGFTLSGDQKVLFTIPIEYLDNGDVIDLDYNPTDRLIYIITEDEEQTDDESYTGYQFSFTLDGVLVENSTNSEIDGLQRMGIEFDEGDVISLEYDSMTGASYVFDAKNEEAYGEYDEEEYGGFTVSGNKIVFHRDREYSDDNDEWNFEIGTLDPFITSDGAVKVRSEDAGRVDAFDFSPDGSEFIYGAFTCSDDGIGSGPRVKIVSPDNGELIDEFLLELPYGIGADEMSGGDGMYNAIRGIQATDNYIVVMTKVYYEDIGFIQRYTYDGELIGGVETSYCIRHLAKGPGNSSIYLHPNQEDSSYFDVVQVMWEEEEPTGRPKSIISERTVGGQTTAVFRDDGFGLLCVEDPVTGEMNYMAPLKSDENKVRLRIPFADLLAKVNAGAENLLITYRGNEIAIPMSRFDCAELLDGMPCQDDATIEIQLSVAEDGSTKVVIQVFVVEQVDDMTKVVHRETIQ